MFTDGAHKILASLSLRGNHTPKFHTAPLSAEPTELTALVESVQKRNAGLEEQNFVSTIKHGGGGIKTLKENLQASAEKLGIEENYQFYQENDSKHSAQNARLFGYHTNAPKFRPQPN
ncbi:hypothetical protein TNCV_2052411 [Trichonephila clavipes]|nr:hypothetical protein TNCV_2052411 [Trichonephila clavipes]